MNVPLKIDLNKLTLAPDQEFHLISHFIQRQLGKDLFYRYSVWSLTVILLTKNYLAIYECTYNWINDTWVNDKTHEFFYKDVVSVKTATESLDVGHDLFGEGGKLEKAQMFQLMLSGDSVKVITNDEKQANAILI